MERSSTVDVGLIDVEACSEQLQNHVYAEEMREKRTSRSLLARVVENEEAVGCSVKLAVRILDVIADIRHVILLNRLEKTLQE